MKITILGAAHPYRGGIAAFNERLAHQFQDEGHEVDIVTFTLLAQFLVVIVIPEPSHLLHSFPSARPLAADQLQIKDIEEGIGHNRIASSRTARRTIRTTCIGIALLQHVFGKI